MATYAEAGVNIETGDAASRAAYLAAKSTFPTREGMLGAPVKMDGGFAGLLDFGDFYIVQNDDGVGTKILVGERIGKYDTLGYDLLAMVADDAICIGAEVTSITNTVDCHKVDPEIITQMMAGLAKACQEQQIVIPGGEIAELNTMVNSYTWNAAAVGIVAKDKVITGKDIQVGDIIIGLPAQGFRSNGFSLIRHILKTEFGDDWHNQKYSENQTWGEAVLTPCRIFHADLLKLLGRYGQERKLEVKGLAHITGGGLEGNITRILPEGMGAAFDNLLPVLPVMTELMRIGDVSREEAYKTWNMGMAMAMIVAPELEAEALEMLNAEGIAAQTVGAVTADGAVSF